MNTNELFNRLDELNLDGYKHIKKHNWGEASQLSDWLEERNFKPVGSGAYATVYLSDTEKFVVKVNDGEFDKNYVNFIDFCHQNKSNPHFPKIGKIKQLKTDEGEKWFVVFIEKLESFNTNKVFGVEPNQYRKIVKFFTYLVSSDNITKKLVIKLLSDFDLQETKYTSQLVDIGIIISDFCNHYGINPSDFLDLHDDNLMMRGDTIVVIDPVAN